MKQMIMIGGGAVVLAAATTLGTLFATGALNKQPAAQEVVQAPPPNPFKETRYVELKPEFLVNFGPKSRPRYMSAEISVSTNDPEALAAIKQHMPVIRNNLLMLFGQQNAAELQTPEGKEKLRKAALAAVQAVMKERYGKEGVDDLFFTKLVMQ